MRKLIHLGIILHYLKTYKQLKVYYVGFNDLDAPPLPLPFLVGIRMIAYFPYFLTFTLPCFFRC